MNRRQVTPAPTTNPEIGKVGLAQLINYSRLTFEFIRRHVSLGWWFSSIFSAQNFFRLQDSYDEDPSFRRL
jgi:hypothetical protein